MNRQSFSKRKQDVQSSSNEATSIDWILNLINAFPKEELEETNMMPLSNHAKLLFQETDQLKTGCIYTYIQTLKKFARNQFWLFPNMLVMLPYVDIKQSNLASQQQQKQSSEQGQPTEEPLNLKKQELLDQSEYLILSSCSVEKKMLKYKEFLASGMILSSGTGQTYLYFDSHFQLLEWYNVLKSFCKQHNFMKKFTIMERTTVQNTFTCINNKNRKPYTVQIHRLSELGGEGPQKDAVLNEVNILMSSKHVSLLKYEGLYEDAANIYVLYEYWVGDPLYKLIQQGVLLESEHIASILLQVMKVTKFLHQSQLYHGCITPQNIIILRKHQKQSGQIQLVLTGFAYRDQNLHDVNWLLNKLPPKWIPPEYRMQNQSVNKFDPFKLDTYLIGCTMYYLLIYKSYNKGIQDTPFVKTIENLEINYLDLVKVSDNQSCQEQSFKGCLLSQSQIELLLRLLQPNSEERITVQLATKHHWFINQKSKHKRTDKQRILPSLKTILEIREYSSPDVIQKQQRQLRDKKVSISYCQKNSIIENQIQSVSNYDDIHVISEENSDLQRFMQELQSNGQLTCKSLRQRKGTE